MSISVKDFKGNEYKSISEMCSAYCMSLTTFSKRRARGYCLEDALTGKYLCNKEKRASNKGSSIACFDYLGNHFRSIKEMCDAYSISVNRYYYRIEHGYGLKEALVGKARV